MHSVFSDLTLLKGLQETLPGSSRHSAMTLYFPQLGGAVSIGWGHHGKRNGIPFKWHPLPTLDEHSCLIDHARRIAGLTIVLRLVQTKQPMTSCGL